MGKNKWHFVFLMVSIGVGIGSYNYIGMNLKGYKAGDLGLGIATTTHEAIWNKLQVSQSMGNHHEILDASKVFQKEYRNIALLIGNSQLHAINQYKNGDHLAVYYANKTAESRGLNIRYLQLSSPNINLFELLIYYMELLEEGIKPKWVVVGVPYRSYQLSGFRPQFLDNLAKLELEKFGLSPEALEFYTEALQKREISSPTVQKYPQDIIEDKMIAFLEDRWEPYQYRGNVRSKIQILPGAIYQEYFVDGLLLTGSKYIIEENITYLEELFRLAVKNNTKVLVYSPPDPLTNSKQDYVKGERELFFSNMETRCKKYDHVYFEDFGNVIPDEMFGLNNHGWLDIFHFQDKGHIILGKKINEFFLEHQIKNEIQ